MGFVGILCFVFGCNCMEFFASIAVDVADLQCAVLLHQGTAAPFQRCALFKTSQPSVSVCPSLESHPPKQLTYSPQAPTRAWPLLPKASCRPLPELHQPTILTYACSGTAGSPVWSYKHPPKTRKVHGGHGKRTRTPCRDCRT